MFFHVASLHMHKPLLVVSAVLPDSHKALQKLILALFLPPTEEAGEKEEAKEANDKSDDGKSESDKSGTIEDKKDDAMKVKNGIFINI